MALAGSQLSSVTLTEPRTVGRRRPLPSGRAVVGAFLIAVAATGSYVAARGATAGPSHSYVVAAHDVPAGSSLTAADLTLTTVDLPDSLADGSFASPADLVGEVSVAPLHAGELVQSSAVVGGAKADPRFQVSVPLERSRALDGAVTPGELVDVLATYGTGGDATTIVVARGAQVVGVDQGRASSIGGSSSDIVLLLALPSGDEVLAVSHAAQAGKVTLVRTTGAAAAATPDGADQYRPSLDASIGGETQVADS